MDWSGEELGRKLEDCTRGFTKEERIGFYQALRIALTGQKVGPPIHKIIWALGKERSIQRLQEAEEKLRLHLTLG